MGLGGHLRLEKGAGAHALISQPGPALGLWGVLHTSALSEAWAALPDLTTLGDSLKGPSTPSCSRWVVSGSLWLQEPH